MSLMRFYWVVMLILAAFSAVVACSSGDDDDDDAVDDGTVDNSEGRETDTGLSFDLACVDHATEDDGTDDTPFADAVTVNTVESCTYWRDAAGLSISLREDEGNGDGYIGIFLVDFVGPGAYVTGLPLDSNVVEMAGSVGEYDSAGDTDGDDSPAKECTVTVDTNLHEVEIPDGGASNGWVEVDVQCPQLGASGIGMIECTIAPTTWSFVIANCEAGL